MERRSAAADEQKTLSATIVLVTYGRIIDGSPCRCATFGKACLPGIPVPADISAVCRIPACTIQRSDIGKQDFGLFRGQPAARVYHMERRTIFAEKMPVPRIPKANGESGTTGIEWIGGRSGTYRFRSCLRIIGICDCLPCRLRLRRAGEGYANRADPIVAPMKRLLPSSRFAARSTPLAARFAAPGECALDPAGHAPCGNRSVHVRFTEYSVFQLRSQDSGCLIKSTGRPGVQGAVTHRSVGTARLRQWSFSMNIKRLAVISRKKAPTFSGESSGNRSVMAASERVF